MTSNSFIDIGWFKFSVSSCVSLILFSKYNSPSPLPLPSRGSSQPSLMICPHVLPHASTLCDAYRGSFLKYRLNWFTYFLKACPPLSQFSSATFHLEPYAIAMWAVYMPCLHSHDKLVHTFLTLLMLFPLPKHPPTFFFFQLRLAQLSRLSLNSVDPKLSSLATPIFFSLVHRHLPVT